MSTASGKSKQDRSVAPDESGGRRQETARKRRDERMKQYERNRRQWMMTKIGAGILAALIVLGIALFIVNYVRDRELNRVPDGVMSYTYAGGDHNNEFNVWTEIPPVGGTHHEQWQKCGFYDGQINPGMGVHTLEHGAVWITYSPDLPQEQIDKLREYGDDDYMLISEYPGLPAPIVASSWGKQLKLQNADDEALKQFIRVFKNNPEYAPEPGATCSNGVDTTID